MSVISYAPLFLGEEWNGVSKFRCSEEQRKPVTINLRERNNSGRRKAKAMVSRPHKDILLAIHPYDRNQHHCCHDEQKHAQVSFIASRSKAIIVLANRHQFHMSYHQLTVPLLPSKRVENENEARSKAYSIRHNTSRHSKGLSISLSTYKRPSLGCEVERMLFLTQPTMSIAVFSRRP